MKHAGFVGFCLTMTALSTYFLVTAPPPLEAVAARAEATVPIERVFDTVNRINARARQIYTKEIVGAGKRVGLKFDEEWRDERVQAGPLPALFLRATAAALERDPMPLGLFLGSDYPINPSNRFSPEQLARFEQVRTDGDPRYGRVEGESTLFGMYADLASAEACVTCHNEHKDTPKSDWRLNDTMGATTWTFPRPMVSGEEYVQLVEALYQAIAAGYGLYLDEVATFEQQPVIGEQWPRDGFFLPSGEVFMNAVRQATAPDALMALASDLMPKRPGAPVAGPDRVAIAQAPAARPPVDPEVAVIPASFPKKAAGGEHVAAIPSRVAAPGAIETLGDDVELTIDAGGVCIAGSDAIEVCFSAVEQSCALSMRPRAN